MNEESAKFWKNRDEKVLNFYKYKLCSVKQFVCDGNLYIDNESTNFNSKFVNVIITRDDGKTFTLKCDKAISNGIKTGEIDEDFLLHEEFEEFEGSTPYFNTYCCIFYKDKEYTIKFDITNNFCGPWDFLAIEDPDDDRFLNRSFKKLCSIEDYIGEDGNFYQNKTDNREFVITRHENDQSPVRLLCSQELEFQLSNGKNPKDLLEHYIGIYVNDNGEEFLRIFDANSKVHNHWYGSTGTLFIIDQVLKNPYKYSFINVSFNELNYLKIK